MTNHNLISLGLVKENDKYFLKAVYRVEDEEGIWEETYPRIQLPILQSNCPLLNCTLGIIGDHTATIDLGFGELPLKLTPTGHFAERKLVKKRFMR